MQHALPGSWRVRHSFSSWHLVSSVSVLHRSLLQYVPACCIAICRSMFQRVAVRCSVLFVTLVASSNDSFVCHIFFRPPLYTSHGQLAGWSCMNDSCMWRDSFFWGGVSHRGRTSRFNLVESSGMKDSCVWNICFHQTKHLHTWNKSRPSLCGCVWKEKKNVTRKNHSCHSTPLDLAVTCVPTTHPTGLGHKSRPSLVESSGANDSYVRLFFFPNTSTHTHPTGLNAYICIYVYE